MPVNNLQPAYQVLLCTLGSLYPIRDYHRAIGLLAVPHKEGVSIYLWACSHKPQVQKEKSTRAISCSTNQCCNTFFCILFLMSRTGLLLPPLIQQQLQPHLSVSVLPLVIHLAYTVEKHSQTVNDH